MSRDSRTILRFAVAGTVIAAAVSAGFFAYLKTGPPNNWITIAVVLVAIIVCPGFIPFAWAAGIEMEIPSLLVVGLIVMAINSALYAAIGVAYVRLRSWREKELPRPKASPSL